MGAWNFIEHDIWRVKDLGYDLRHVARVESGSPATGSKTVHDQELADLMDEVFRACEPVPNAHADHETRDLMPPQSDMPALFVADGSNLATEGRDMPSLAHLNEALAAFREEYPGIKLTVVVDATFGHRIAKTEVTAFDEAVANNEIVTPPAGAVGRGDAFVLSDRRQGERRVLSNDSFQEFHGDYEWLFDDGPPDRRQARPARRLGLRRTATRSAGRRAGSR